MTFNFQTMKTKDPNLKKSVQTFAAHRRQGETQTTQQRVFIQACICYYYNVWITFDPTLIFVWLLKSTFRSIIYWIIFPSCPWIRIFLFKCLHLRSSWFCLQLWLKKVPFGNRVMKHWNESFLKNKVDSEDESRGFSINLTV